ncbi:hypothetical protein BD779DRAFT_1683448 [Infundibulicybe gibba]|nr:hypothetical protein BD779DRAFT_1683448 [Infundibulicybe gibba]
MAPSQNDDEVHGLVYYSRIICISIQRAEIREKPFQHPAIIAGLRGAYFTGQNCAFKKFLNRFPTTPHKGSTRTEIPITMLAMVATMIGGILQNSTSDLRDVYRFHMEFIGEISKKNPQGYHTMLATIYQLTSGVDQPQSSRTNAVAGALAAVNFADMDVN